MNLVSILAVTIAVVFLISSILLFVNLGGSKKRIEELERLLNQAGNEASSSKRALEASEEKHKSTIEQLKQAERKQSDLEKKWSEERSELEQSLADKDQQVQDLDTQIKDFDPVRKRAREAEQKVLSLQKDMLALRNEYVQTSKRIETAESATRDKQIKFERAEASLEAKDKALLVKQKESTDLAHQLNERRAEITELVSERDKLLSMESALKEKLQQTEESLKETERARQQLNDEFTECRLQLGETQEQLNRLKQMFDEQSAAGENDVEQIQKLRDQLLDVEGKLSRKEAALSDLELVHGDSNRETPYEAHKHMEWTLNHFDDKSLTFKFNNLGAKVFLVHVETNFPQLRYEFETGRELPRGKDFESRVKVAIRKSEQQKMKELPAEFDMTVFYALNIYPIDFKIRPHKSQKIERIQ